MCGVKVGAVPKLIGVSSMNGFASQCRPGSIGAYTGTPAVRAFTSAVTFETWWSPVATCSRTSCSGVFGSGSSVRWWA